MQNKRFTFRYKQVDLIKEVVMENTKQYLGARIQELRKTKSLKQAELAEILNIDAKHISKIECGRCFPSFELLDKIASVLDVEPAELLQTSHLKAKAQLIEEINLILQNSSEDKIRKFYIVLKNL